MFTQYKSVFSLWLDYCSRRQMNPILTDVVTVLDFMYELYNQGKSYSLLNTTQSALSSFVLFLDGKDLGYHPLISRFLKGVFNLRPPIPRYTHIWDVRPVLNYLRSLSPIQMLSLKQLTIKLCMLLALVSTQRCQTLHKLRIDKCQSNQIVSFLLLMIYLKPVALVELGNNLCYSLILQTGDYV